MERNEQAMQNAMRMARSSQGQQLFNVLQNNHRDVLNEAMRHASSGDYAGAQQVLSQLLSDPETQKLLKQLGGSHE